METMVERVAMALALADLDPETRAAVNIDAHMAYVREHYSELARAAIELMRTPTDAMIKAGAIYQANGKSAVTNAVGTWTAMIDAALLEKE